MAAIAVPMFFAISGYLFFCSLTPSVSGFVSKLQRKYLALLTPYLAWPLLVTVTYNVIAKIPSLAGAISTNSDLILGDESALVLVRRLVLDHPFLIQFWFLRDIILLNLLSPLLYLGIVRGRAIVPCVFITLWGLGYATGPERAVISSTALGFFSLGGYLAIRGAVQWNPRIRVRIALLGLWLGSVAALQLGSTPLPQCAAPPVVLLGMLAAWYGYDCLKPLLETRTMRWLAQFTFFIYAGHQPLLANLGRKVAPRVLGSGPGYELIAFLILPVIAVGACVSVAYVLKRYAPPVYQVLTGGR